MIGPYMTLSLPRSCGTVEVLRGFLDRQVYELTRFTAEHQRLPSEPDTVEGRRRLRYLERFRRERLQVAERLQCIPMEGIIRLKEWITDGSYAYMVSEPLLEEAVPFQRPMGEATAALPGQMAELCSLLLAVHRQGLLHGDVQPQNLLLQRGKLLLGGFATACLPEDLPADDDWFGDPLYHAPELVRRSLGYDVPVDAAADRFSLGLTLHTVLTGELPAWDRKGFVTPAEALLGERYIKLSPKLPPEMKRLITALLSPLPGNRPTDGELLAELEAFAQSGWSECPEPLRIPSPVPLGNAPPQQESPEISATIPSPVSMGDALPQQESPENSVTIPSPVPLGNMPPQQELPETLTTIPSPVPTNDFLGKHDPTAINTRGDAPEFHS